MSNADGLTKLLTILLIVMVVVLVILVAVFIFLRMKSRIKKDKVQGNKKDLKTKDKSKVGISNNKTYKEYTTESIFKFMDK